GLGPGRHARAGPGRGPRTPQARPSPVAGRLRRVLRAARRTGRGPAVTAPVRDRPPRPEPARHPSAPPPPRPAPPPPPRRAPPPPPPGPPPTGGHARGGAPAGPAGGRAPARPQTNPPPPPPAPRPASDRAAVRLDRVAAAVAEQHCRRSCRCGPCRDWHG